MKKICGGSTSKIEFISANELCLTRQNKVRIIDINDGHKILCEYGKISNLVRAAISPSKKDVVLVNTLGQIFAYNYETRECIFEYKKGTTEGNTQILFVNNEEFVITDWDSNVIKVNLDKKSVTKIMKNPNARYFENFLSYDKSQIIFFNEQIKEYGMDSEIVVYDIAGEGITEEKKFVYNNMRFESVSRCKDYFYCGIFDGINYRIVKINANSYDKEDICIVGTDIGQNFNSIIASPDEKYIVTAISNSTSTVDGIQIFDCSGNIICQRKLDYVEDMKFGSDGFLYIATCNGVYVCDIEKEILAKEHKKTRKKRKKK